ncbi:MAG TPA: class II aldolase/adducin family protein [Tepidiformaceae bacterium]|nr:class II aldolase/adducin family protein [Tepidiformaceae bacterium]
MTALETHSHSHAPEDDSILFAVVGNPTSETHRWFVEGLCGEMRRLGHTPCEDPPAARLVLNVTSLEQPAAYRRRKTQTTYSVGILEGYEEPEDFVKAAYPLLVKSLSNLAIYLVWNGTQMDAHFVTMEQGHYVVRQDPSKPDDVFFQEVFERLSPLVTAQLVINNVYVPDLPEELWAGDELTRQCQWAGEQLDEMNLLPAPWPVQDLLSERDLRHVMLLYGIGGLSYGNLSVRRDATSFWMSASGVNKARLQEVGRDILLVTGFDAEQHAMTLSVPPNVKPRRVSVDAIEHYMIYREHPDVGAIIHIHAWMDGTKSTHINYPCGTRELALSVSELVRRAPDPSRAIVGLKNHGLTITGHSLPEIFERIEGKVIPQVPMS